MKTQRIFQIAILVLIIGLGGYKYWEYQNPDKTIDSIVTTTEQTIQRSTTVQESTAVASARNSINIDIDTPINGTYRGVIEVGASGFNSFIINSDNNDNWELVSKEFGESLAYEGFATTSDVKTGIKKYLAKMFDKGVAGRNAHFVMSSGALKNPKNELIAQGIEEMGYVVNRVTPEQEGAYALRALLGKNYRNNSFIVDIGSGNTKISWIENDRVKSLEGPGAKYYQNKITDSQVSSEIQSLISKVPSSVRQNCFIIGGVPYKLAKQVRNGKERFTLLSPPDDYSGGDDVKMKSGINIYRTIFNSSGCNTFVFDWDANFTIGFLLTLN